MPSPIFHNITPAASYHQVLGFLDPNGGDYSLVRDEGNGTSSEYAKLKIRGDNTDQFKVVDGSDNDILVVNGAAGTVMARITRSNTPSFEPTSLEVGQLFANIADGLMWIGDAAGDPLQLTGAPHTHTFADITGGGATTGQTLYWSGSAWTPSSIIHIDPTGGSELITLNGSLVITEDLTISGDVTYVNVADLQVEDKNILINRNGTVASADGSGFTVYRGDADPGAEEAVQLIYKPSVYTQSGWALYHESEANLREILTTSSTGINAANIGAGTVSNAEFGYLANVDSDIQAQLDGKSGTAHTHDDRYFTETELSSDGTASVHFNNLTNTPTTLAGYGLSGDAYTKTEIVSILTGYYTQSALQGDGTASVHWNNLTNTPTTIAGYGITDVTAANTALDTTNLDGLLSAADTTVQAALETLDDVTYVLEDLTNINVGTPNDGDYLYWNAGAAEWQAFNPDGSDHNHNSIYYTETELDAGQLDTRYYTETELDAGQLDTRYYTETEISGDGTASVHWNNLTNTPTTVTGYGITDVYTKTEQQGDGTAALHWGNLTNIPASLSAAGDILDAQQEPTGFEEVNTDTTIAFTEATRTFTIDPSGADYNIWQSGVKTTISTQQSIVIDDTEGLHHIYFDNGVLAKTTTFEPHVMIGEKVYVANIYWDATNGEAVIFGDERHGLMPWQTHLLWHIKFGTSYLSGLAIGDITAGENGTLDSHATLSITTGSIRDEDIPLTIDAQTSPAQIPVLYRTGANGDWRQGTVSNAPLINTGSGRLAYNEWTGTTWQLSEVTNNDYVLIHLFATNDARSSHQIVAVLGQGDYGNIGDARVGANTEINSLITTGLPFQEFVIVGTIIYQTGNTKTNTWKASIELTDEGADYVDWRDTELSPGVALTSHSNLTDIDLTNSHPASAISADPTNFDGILSGTDTDVQTALETIDDHTHAFSEITSTPTTLSGYGITDAYTQTQLQGDGTAQVHWNNIASTPTTVAGYGITDAMTTAHAANAITGTQITNWDTAYGWGDHDGLYLPIGGGTVTGNITIDQGAVAANPRLTFDHDNFGTAVYFIQVDRASGAMRFMSNDIYAFDIASTGIANFASTPTVGGTDVSLTTHNHTLNSLSNVNIVTPGDGDYVVWNESAGEWQSFTATGADHNHNDMYYTETELSTSGSGAAVHWDNITNTPTTVAGYGITDAMTTAHDANVITSTNISNWNTAYGWGDHSGAGYAVKTNDETIGGTWSFTNSLTTHGGGLTFNTALGTITYVKDIIFSWAADTYGTVGYHGISSRTATGTVNDDLSLYSYDEMNFFIDTNGNDGSSWNYYSNGRYAGANLVFQISDTGTITLGEWNGTAIADSYISSATDWNTAYTHSQTTTGNPHSIAFADLTDWNEWIVDNVNTDTGERCVVKFEDSSIGTYDGVGIYGWIIDNNTNWGDNAPTMSFFTAHVKFSGTQAYSITQTRDLTDIDLVMRKISDNEYRLKANLPIQHKGVRVIWKEVENGGGVVVTSGSTSTVESTGTLVIAAPTIDPSLIIQDSALSIGWGQISSTPTTVAGYGITDAMTTAHDANVITSTDIGNWNTAHGWGDHSVAGYLTAADLSDYTQYDVNETITGNWTFSGILKNTYGSDGILLEHDLAYYKATSNGTGVSDGAGYRAESNAGAWVGLYAMGSNYTGTRFGISLANSTWLRSVNATALFIGTEDAAPVYLGANDTLVATIESAGTWTFNNAIKVDSNKLLYFRDTEIWIGSNHDGHLDLEADISVDINTDLVVSTGDIKVDALKKIYFDGGNNTYISETAADVLSVYAGGTRSAYFGAGGTYFQNRDVTVSTLLTINGGAVVDPNGYQITFERDITDRRLLDFKNNGTLEWSLDHNGSNLQIVRQSGSGYFTVGTASAYGFQVLGGIRLTDYQDGIDPSGHFYYDSAAFYFRGENGGSVDTNMYIRRSGSWRQVLTTLDEGSGNGLDADTLDTYEATAFPRKAEDATISGTWTYSSLNVDVINSNGGAKMMDMSSDIYIILGDEDGLFEGLTYNPQEGAGTYSSRYWVRFDYTQDASFPYLTNRTPGGMWKIYTGGDTGGSEVLRMTFNGGAGDQSIDLSNTSKFGWTNNYMSGGYWQISGTQPILALAESDTTDLDKEMLVSGGHFYIRNRDDDGSAGQNLFSINGTTYDITTYGNINASAGYLRVGSGSFDPGMGAATSSIFLDGANVGIYYEVDGYARNMIRWADSTDKIYLGQNSVYVAGMEFDIGSAKNYIWRIGATQEAILDNTGMTLTGELTATAKNFKIDHPIKKGKKLMHGSLEGPEHGVYVRGVTSPGTNMILLPDYWKKLVDQDSVTVQLTVQGHPSVKVALREISRFNEDFAATPYVDFYLTGWWWRRNKARVHYEVRGTRIDVKPLQVEIDE